MRCDACNDLLDEKPAREVVCSTCHAFTRLCSACVAAGVRTVEHVHRADPPPQADVRSPGIEAKPRETRGATISTMGIVGHKPGDRRPFP